MVEIPNFSKPHIFKRDNVWFCVHIRNCSVVKGVGSKAVNAYRMWQRNTDPYLFRNIKANMVHNFIARVKIGG